MDITVEKLSEFLKDSVDWLIDEDLGCTTLKLDDKLAVCVGWLPGYGKDKRDDVIQSKSEPDFAINAGIKVYTSDDMRTDYEFINMPYYKNGDVIETDVSIEPNEDYDKLAEYLLKEYEGMKDLEMTDDGEIIEKTEEVEECKKPLKETWDGESVIDDLVERAQDMYDSGDYGDIDECVLQAIDDGLIYTDDIYTLVRHYGSMNDSDLIASFYDDLYSDIYGRIEEHEDESEDEDDDWEDEEEESEE